MADLRLRIASGRAASASGRPAAACPCRPQRACPRGAAAARLHARRRDGAPQQHEQQELDEEEFEDNSFRVVNRFNTDPDWSDPEWFKKVTDWTEFWNYTRWDLEVEGVEDGVDVGGHDTRDLDRIHLMAQALEDVQQRGDVLNWIPPQMRRDHSDSWIDPPVRPIKAEEVPDMSEVDVRALAEKMRKRQLIDIEWRRRQAKIGKAKYLDNSNDTRLKPFAWTGEQREWSPEEVYTLITMDGLGCRPEDHQGIVENPLASVDLVNTMGVKWIPDTEDFLEELGHLGVPSQMRRLPREVVIDLENDLVSAELKDQLLGADFQAQRLQAAEAIAPDNTYTGDPREWTA